MELDTRAALAALRQLLECCKSAETVVDYAGRYYTVKVSPVDFRDAQIKALSRYARYQEPIDQALSALHAAGFVRPWPNSNAPGLITESWLAEGDNAWQIVAHLAPIVQVNNDQRAPVTIWESWPSLEAIRLLSNKIRQTIAELEQQAPALPLEAKEDAAAAAPEPPDKRGEWIYHKVMKGDRFSAIIRALDKKPKTWERIGTVNGIKNAANSYANKHGLPLPPPRKKGRPNMK
jgi:hypothetical protein